MASKELTQAFENYENYINTNGVTEEAVEAYMKALAVCFNNEFDYTYGLTKTVLAKGYIESLVKKLTGGGDIWFLDRMAYEKRTEYRLLNQYYQVLLYESYENFESYIYYLEKKRDPVKRFYLPRKKTLQIVLRDLEELDKSDLKFYGLSLPSRTGKSTLCILFLSWIAMKRPNSHNAMGGHSGLLAKGFYKELLNIMSTEDYAYEELYNYWNTGHACIRDKSSEDFTITMDEPDRFPTITCRGIDGTWTGAVDISKDGYLYVDDLVRDREHSLSPTRMENTWQEYLNKMVDRKNDGAKELMVGTLWNVLDPLERMSKIYANDPRYKFRRIPALNENDESNFDYEINGFSTQYYREMRERLDNAEWMAKYQQQPYVREGLLFPDEELNYYLLENLDSDDNNNTIAICDPALGGGDYLSFPVCKYNKERKEKYIVDWVFNNKSTKVTVPLMADAIYRHHIPVVKIETDGKSAIVERELKDELERRGCNFCTIVSIGANRRISKEDKINGSSDYIKDNFYFIKAGTKGRSSEYDDAMSWLQMYTSVGKNVHDDAPDSLAMLALHFKPLAENSIDVPEFNPFRDRGYYGYYG